MDSTDTYNAVVCATDNATMRIQYRIAVSFIDDGDTNATCGCARAGELRVMSRGRAQVIACA